MLIPRKVKHRKQHRPHRTGLATCAQPLVGPCAHAADLLRALAEDEPRRVAYGAELAALQRCRFSVEEQQRRTDEVYRSLG